MCLTTIYKLQSHLSIKKEVGLKHHLVQLHLSLQLMMHPVNNVITNAIKRKILIFYVKLH